MERGGSGRGHESGRTRRYSSRREEERERMLDSDSSPLDLRYSIPIQKIPPISNSKLQTYPQKKRIKRSDHKSIHIQLLIIDTTKKPQSRGACRSGKRKVICRVLFRHAGLSSSLLQEGGGGEQICVG